MSKKFNTTFIAVMSVLLLVNGGGSTMMSTDAHAAGEKCEVSIGDTVSFLDPAEVYSSMQGMQLVKDEFETTADFAKRLAAAEAKSNFNKPILLRGTYGRSFTKYDADNSRIVMIDPAWGSGSSIGLEHVFGYGNEYGIKVSSRDKVHSAWLQYNSQDVGTFTASNAYGASVEVTQIHRDQYGIFDRKNPSEGDTWESEGQFVFPFDGKLAILFDGEPDPAVFIPISADEAKRVISNLQVGILAKPKKPFTAEGVEYSGATIDNPREVTAKYHVFMADMICAVITDDKRRVIKTIDVAY